MIKVSVIVPVYNVEKYLDRCVESIRNQTLEDIEIILINDGSKDASIDICRKYSYQDKRIKVIDKSNSGPSETRNIGIELAKGEYVTFVDSDDWIDCTMFENLYNKAKQTDCNIIISNYFRNYVDKEESIKLNIEQEYLNREEIKKQLIFPLIGKKDFITEENILGFGSPCGRLFKRDMLISNKIRFNEDLLIGEDLLFNIEALSKVDYIILDKNAYYHYFNNTNSIMTSYKQDCWNIYKKSIKAIEKYLNKNNYEYEVGDRFTIMKLDCVSRTVQNECKYTNNKNILTKLSYIKNVCKDKIVQDAISKVDCSKLDFKRKVRIALIKYKASILLYFYYKNMISK